MPYLVKNKNIYIYLGLILTICILCYNNSLSNTFSNLDDQVQVTENPDIRDLDFKSIADIFSSSYVGMYQPITTFCYAVIYNSWKLTPFAYHAFSLLLHLFNCILVFALLRKFVENPIVVLFLTAVFALHPMQVESVAWISATSNLLFSFFFFLALIFYIIFQNSKKNWYYFFSLLFFIFSCFSKVTAVTFPLVLLLVDWFKNKEIKISSQWNKIPFFIISIIFGVIAMNTRKDAGHLSDLSLDFSIIDRLFLISYSILFYPFKLLIPSNFSAFYPYPQAISLMHYLSLPILLVVGFFIVRSIKKFPLLFFGAAFYMITISVVLQLIPVGNQLTTDRYIYLPMLGLLLMLSVALVQLEKWRKGITLPAFLLLVLFGFLTYERTKIWADDAILWKDVLGKYPNVAQAWNNLGNLVLKEGNMQQALMDYNKAIELQPNYADAYSNRGVILSQMGRTEQAVRDFEHALALRAHADAYFNLANELVKLGDYNSAIANYNESIVLTPHADSYSNRAFAKLRLGKNIEAVLDLDSAIDIDPNYAKAYFLKGMVLIQMQKRVEACYNFNEARKLGHQKAKEAFEQFCMGN